MLRCWNAWWLWCQICCNAWRLEKDVTPVAVVEISGESALRVVFDVVEPGFAYFVLQTNA